MKHIRLFSLFAVLLALTACGGTDPDVPEETIEVTDYVFSTGLPAVVLHQE